MPGEVQYCFSRSLRLTEKDFAAVMQAGKFIRGRGVAVLLKNNGKSAGRLGVIAPKRIMARAVDRNRVKRIVREWFRCSNHRLQGSDCVVRLTARAVCGHGERALIAEIERLIPAGPQS